jgi:hypothetical protein
VTEYKGKLLASVRAIPRAGAPVYDNPSNSGSDWILFGIPLIALLAFSFFRLDEVFTAHKKGSKASRHPASVPPRKGSLLGTDPDGRAWDDPPSSKT